MKQFRKLNRIIKGKTVKRLAGLTAATALPVICIVFFAVLFLNSYSKLRLLDQYIREVPAIVADREAEMETRSGVFEEDVLARGGLGTRIFQDAGSPDVMETLEEIRGTVSAGSVSLADRNGRVLYTTGAVSPEEVFKERVRTLEPREPYLEIYPVSAEDGGNGEKKDGSAFVMFPVDAGAGRRLVFEFSCAPLMDVYNAIGDWPDILQRMLSGLDASAFVRTEEGGVAGYLSYDVPEDEREKLFRKAEGIFQKSRRFFPLGDGTSFGLVMFRNRTAAAVYLPYPERSSEILLVAPLRSLLNTGLYCALAISLFIILNLILFCVYAVKSEGWLEEEEDRKEALEELKRRTRAGRRLLLAAVACFSFMLLALENRATIAFIGTTKRIALQSEAEWHGNQGAAIRGTYSGIYRTRTQALAEYLTEHREYRTRGELKAFRDILKADYLMLFDRNGDQVIASNSYTGFTLNGPDANLSAEYRAVLLGYPDVVVGPEKDSYSGKQQIGAAALLTKEDGLADGFLMAVFDAGGMEAELKGTTLENAVSSFAVTEGYKAAVINNEDGRFLAHTDQNRIGLEAKYYITEDAYGDDYAEFTEYDGKPVYVSGVSADGKSILMVVPDRTGDREELAAVLMIALLILIIAGLYCPKVCTAIAADGPAEPSGDGEEVKPERKDPISVFGNGYILFFTALAGAAFLAAYAYEWPAFTFVFGGMWSRGVHLFSIWAAAFFMAVTLTILILVRMALAGAEKRTNLRTRTLLKLADSFAAYSAGALLLVGILYMFGVNTTALLASAGIVSIAVGMGSKDMVADILAGLFLAMENSIHMGDVVTVGSWKGRVTDMGIRTTEITDDSQNVKILNNSHISDVVNMSRRKTACVMELTLPRSGSMAETERLLKKTVDAALEALPELYGSLKLEGMYNITPESCTAKLSYTCAEAARESAAKRLQKFMDESIAKEGEKEDGV